jgi:uncharacterized membrane protein
MYKWETKILHAQLYVHGYVWPLTMPVLVTVSLLFLVVFEVMERSVLSNSRSGLRLRRSQHDGGLICWLEMGGVA